MTRLVLLALLKDRPMHGYEIQQIIQEQKMERWANILSGSIYFALTQMEKEGLIRAEAEERTGNRLRKIYAMTDQGKEALFQLLREALTRPPHSLKSDFSLALGFSSILSSEERKALLEQNLADLEQIREFWRVGQLTKSGIHPALAALFRNDLHLIDQDLTFLRELIALNQVPVGKTEVRLKATHLSVVSKGEYQGNPFTYQEVISLGNYQDSQWWRMFQSSQAEEVFEATRAAYHGESFSFKELNGAMMTEILAIHREDS